jgi:UPF0716 protein FxsA
MVMRPLLRYAALYALVEAAAVVLLIWAFGLGWTLVVVAATFMAGVLLAASQVKGQFVAARRARSNPETAVADGMLVGLGSFLVFMPGVVSTAAGALMLAPPTRGAMRPVAATMLTRGVVRRLGSFSMTSTPNAGARAGRGDYIDGEVIDGDVLRDVSGQLPARR